VSNSNFDSLWNEVIEDQHACMMSHSTKAHEHLS